MTLTEMIEKDISYCDSLIEKNYASSDDVLCLVSKYKKIDNKFGNERHNYVRTIGDNINEIKNISDSKEPKETKWTRCKAILNFLLDKGADFVITYLPQIIMYCKIFLNK